MLFASLLKHNYLLNNKIYNFKKNMCSIVNVCHKSDLKNIYINKKQLKMINSTCCKYCKGTGWIIWKTNNLYDLKLSKSSLPLYSYSYSLCYKCR